MDKIKKYKFFSIPIAAVLFSAFLQIFIISGEDAYLLSVKGFVGFTNALKVQENSAIIIGSILFFAVLVLAFLLASCLCIYALNFLNSYFKNQGIKKGILYALGIFGGNTLAAVLCGIPLLLLANKSTLLQFTNKLSRSPYALLFILWGIFFSIALMSAASAIYLLLSLWKAKNEKSFKAVFTVASSAVAVVFAALAFAFARISYTCRFFNHYSIGNYSEMRFYITIIASGALICVAAVLFCIGLYKKGAKHWCVNCCLVWLLGFFVTAAFIQGSAEYMYKTERFESVGDVILAELAVPLTAFDEDGVVCIGTEKDGTKVYIASRPIVEFCKNQIPDYDKIVNPETAIDSDRFLGISHFKIKN